jgi:hypothetical protein
MVSHADRSAQLGRLIESLQALVGVLDKDPKCQWTRHFRTCLLDAQELQARGFTQPELNDLSARVNSPYGGMGSFNDYFPSTDVGTERLQEFSSEVYDRALQLRVVGSYLSPIR